MKIYTQEEMLNNHIGKIGTPNREAFERELKIDLIGDFIKEIRKRNHLNLCQLSQLIGIEKTIVDKMEKKSIDIPSDNLLDKAYTVLKSIYEEQAEVTPQSYVPMV